MVDNAMKYNNHIVKPDLTYPLIGDTSKKSPGGVTKSYQNFVDYEAGIAILEFKNKDELSKSDYLSFKSVYQSITHKHLDDLAITYHNFGHDILIDSGKYS